MLTDPASHRFIAIDCDHLPRSAGKLRCHFTRCDQHSRLRITQHERETLDGIGRIERQVCGAGLQNSKRANYAGQRTIETKTNNAFFVARADSQRNQVMRQLVRATVQLAVSHHFGAVQTVPARPASRARTHPLERGTQLTWGCNWRLILRAAMPATTRARMGARRVEREGALVVVREASLVDIMISLGRSRKRLI